MHAFAHRALRMTELPVIIAGGGIGGLATALTLHQIGVPCVVYEAVREMRPLGVGINMQPNAVRELYDLGITASRSRSRRPAGARMGAGRAQRQRHLLRGARARRRLQLAAICGASRPVPHAAARQGGGADRRRRGAARQPRDRLSQSCRWRERVRRARRRLALRGARRAADRRRRHPLGGPGADASGAAADPLGRRDHVARHHRREADPQRLVVRRPRHASPAHGVLSDLPSRPAERACDDQLDRRGHDGQHAKAGSRAAGSGR